MSKDFTGYTLDWKGEEYVIPRRTMRVVAEIEGHVRFGELCAYMTGQQPVVSKLCLAYQAALKHAGVGVTAEQVEEDLYAEDDGSGKAVTLLMLALIELVAPPHLRRDFAATREAVKTADVDGDPGNSKAAAAGSKTPTKRRSRKANG